MPESVNRRGSSGPTTGAMLGLWSGVVAIRKEGYGRALQLLLAMVLLMWGLEVVDAVLDHRLDRYGIEPREVAEADVQERRRHHAANTAPFVVMGLVIALGGPLRLLGVTAMAALVSGVGTWLIAPADTIHLGASGVVFGYATYLIARGWFTRRLAEIAIGVVVALVWGGALLAGLQPQEGISWQGHLFGAIGGVMAARVFSEPRERRVEAWR
jgi:hypothetical protein